MNDDMPWVIGLSQEEIQKLREDKKRLSEYGRKRLRELNIPENDEIEDIMNIELTEEKKEELEEMRRKERILSRYNDFYNLETSGMPQGMPITIEHLQIITLQSAIDALRCEHLNQEYTHIAISDVEDLIESLDKQANDYLKRVEELKNERRSTEEST